MCFSDYISLLSSRITIVNPRLFNKRSTNRNNIKGQKEIMQTLNSEEVSLGVYDEHKNIIFIVLWRQLKWMIALVFYFIIYTLCPIKKHTKKLFKKSSIKLSQ